MSKQGKSKSNVFRATAGVVANEGIHTAVVISTEYVGDTFTKYGQKDMQMFVLRVKQGKTDGGGVETAEIHQQFHRSFSPQASLVKFLAGFGIQKKVGDEIDFDDLVGKTVTIIVTHKRDANGTVHANVTDIMPPSFHPTQPTQPTPPPAVESPAPEFPEFYCCADSDCTTQVSAKGESCERHRRSQCTAN